MFLAVQKDVFYPDTAIAELLSELSRLSNNLYNQAVYESRQYYFEHDCKPSKVLSYPKVYAALKHSNNAVLLHSQAAQQVMKSANEAFQSFKALSKLWRVGELEVEPRLPRYRTKGGRYQVVFTGQSLSKKG